MSDFTAGAAWAAIGSAAVAALAELGVHPGVLAAAGFGAVCGAPLAPPIGRLLQIPMWASVSVVCAVIGSYLGVGVGKGGQMAWAAGMAVVFHPLTAAATALLPRLLASWARLPPAKEGKDGNP